jgi:site-specific recombinase XerD
VTAGELEPDRGRELVLATDVERVNRYAKAAKAQNTLTGYTKDWARWTEWCAARSAYAGPPADPLTVAAYLTELADNGAAPSTISRRLSGIGYWHRQAGHPSPARNPGVSEVMQGIRRTLSEYQPKKAAALDTNTVRALTEDLPDGLAGVRDRAMILTGFALGLRASDVVGLNVRGIVRTGHGLDVQIVRSKTDQEGAGTTLALSPGTRPGTCPVTALLAWVDAAGLVDGPVFRSLTKGPRPRMGGTRMATSSVTRILRRACTRAGIPARDFSSHSARSGFVTTAIANGVREKDIAETGRWVHMPTLRRYDRSSRWASPASARLGL